MRGLAKPEAPAAKATRKRSKRADGNGTQPAAAARLGHRSASAPLTQPVQAYCVKCKAMREMHERPRGFHGERQPCRGRHLSGVRHASCSSLASRWTMPVCRSRNARRGTPARRHRPRRTAPQAPRCSESRLRPSKSAAKRRPRVQLKTTSAGRQAASRAAKGAAGTGRRQGGPANANDRARRRFVAGERRRHASGKLVIVESPAKARTVGRFLGRGYDVRASVGHVRDLLKSQAVGRPGERLFAHLPGAQREARPGQGAEGGCGPRPARSTWRPTPTARARRLPGTCWRLPRSRRNARAAWCSTRSRATPSTRRSATHATSTCAWSMRSRRAASSTGWSATRSARCSGAGCAAGFRPGACSRWRCG